MERRHAGEERHGQVDPSSPTAALSSWTLGNHLIRSVEDLDDVTLGRLLSLIEEQRRLTQRAFALGALVGYPLIMVGSISVFFGFPIAVLLVGAGALIYGNLNRTLSVEARSLGLAPHVQSDVERIARRVASRVPRWVRGDERRLRIHTEVRAAMAELGAPEHAFTAAKPLAPG